MNVRVKSRRLIGTISLVVPSLLTALCGTAAAEPDTAEEWNAVGVQHRRRLEPAKALEAFRKAHELAPSAKSRGQMGFVEHDLGRYAEAELHLLEALAADADRWVVKNRKYLEEALAMARRHLGRVVINGLAGAAVSIEGAPAGTLPLPRPLSLPEGETSITISAAGHLPWERRLRVTGGRELELTADLVPDRRDFPDPVHIPPPANHTRLQDLPGESHPPAVRDRKVAWTLVGVGAALAGAAIWSYSSREPSCPSAPGRMCNLAPRPSWPSMALAGASAFAMATGITLFAW